MKRIAILGSTGSIGQNALNVIRAFPDHFQVAALAAGNNLDEIQRQISEWKPLYACVAEDATAIRIHQNKPRTTKILVGQEGMVEIVTRKEVDMVIFATTGTWGLAPLLAAIEARKQIALANKESLVMAGRIITGAAQKADVKILPIDSEHNAIFQILNGQDQSQLYRIFLTCSGGPLFLASKEQLEQVTPQQALQHPKWKMGKKITVDSSTLMNKGLEIIEAKWLFGINPDRIQVLIHPEAVVHSMVEFIDGSIVAQMGVADMKGPIQYVLGYPERLPATVQRLNLVDTGKLSFALPDMDRFPCLKIAYEVASSSDSDATIMNAVNDVAVDGFLKEKIRWVEIPQLIETVLSSHRRLDHPTLQEILELDCWARDQALSLIEQRKGRVWVS